MEILIKVNPDLKWSLEFKPYCKIFGEDTYFQLFIGDEDLPEIEALITKHLNGFEVEKNALKKLKDDFDMGMLWGFPHEFDMGMLWGFPYEDNIKLAWVYINGQKKMIGVHNQNELGYELNEDTPTVKIPLIPISYEKFDRWCTTMDL